VSLYLGIFFGLVFLLIGGLIFVDNFFDGGGGGKDLFIKICY